MTFPQLQPPYVAARFAPVAADDSAAFLPHAAARMMMADCFPATQTCPQAPTMSMLKSCWAQRRMRRNGWWMVVAQLLQCCRALCVRQRAWWLTMNGCGHDDLEYVPDCCHARPAGARPSSW